MMENNLPAKPVLRNTPFSLVATTYDEAIQFANILAKSTFVPTHLKNKPEEIFLTIQFGQELGLSPLQSVQNISVINGKPSIWGDAMVALVRRHPEFVDMQESMIKGDTKEEYGMKCIITRKNQAPHTSIFTVRDAVLAGLWGKNDVWKKYPKRMLTWRARTNACRDVFADALKGFISAEEAQDFSVVGSGSTFTPAPVSSITIEEDELTHLYVDENFDPKTGEVIDE